MLNFKHLHYFHTVAKTGAVNRAAEKLHLAPQTLSGQLAQFEQRLGVNLFRRSGRRLELTDTGRRVLAYTEELFQVGAELEELLRGDGAPRETRFRVGIADVVPKAITHRLLAPALALADPVRLICREDRLDRLLAELAIHHLDMVLADRPIPPGMDVKGYSHPLGECGVAFYAAPELAGRLTEPFPRRLHGAPFLLPGEDSALRQPLIRWLERQGVQPRIVGEFDDSALMKAFGQAGAGVFPAADAPGLEIAAHFGVVRLGETSELKERFFAITVERHLSHPAVLAVSQAARSGLTATGVAQ